MICYADSSVFIAWFNPDDQFAVNVTGWVREHVTDFVWNSILRAEVRHNLRRISTRYARTAWNAFRAAERTRLRAGRERLADLLEAADELSAERAGTIPAGTWDYFHVATALHSGASYFATCDQLQADLARATAGFSKVKLFTV